MSDLDALVPVGLPQCKAALTWNYDRSVGLWTDDNLGYEWVPVDDPRMVEVRELESFPDDIGLVGTRAEDGGDSLLIRGESGHALAALLNRSEFSSTFRAGVRLAYIDPPFNTGKQFAHYDDGLEAEQWQTMMRDRLIQIRELLTPNGTVWIHLDEAEESYGKVVADDVFGRGNYLGAVVWRKSTGLRNDARFFSVDHDTIHVYAKDRTLASFVRGERTEEMNAKYTNPDNDVRGPWIESACTAASGTPKMVYPIVNPAGRTVYPPRGTFWRYSEKRLAELLEEDRIMWKNSGDSAPYFKRFLADVADVVNRTWWDHTEAGSGPDGKRELSTLFPHQEPFSTPKPERLMQKVIEIGSEPGDIVLDCFAGSGSTAAVALKMGRRFVTTEWSADTFVNYTEPRLRRVAVAGESGGIGKAIKPGSFRILEVGQSELSDGEPKYDLDAMLRSARTDEETRYTEKMGASEGNGRPSGEPGEQISMFKY